MLLVAHIPLLSVASQPLQSSSRGGDAEKDSDSRSKEKTLQGRPYEQTFYWPPCNRQVLSSRIDVGREDSDQHARQTERCVRSNDRQHESNCSQNFQNPCNSHEHVWPRKEGWDHLDEGWTTSAPMRRCRQQEHPR